MLNEAELNICFICISAIFADAQVSGGENEHCASLPVLVLADDIATETIDKLVKGQLLQHINLRSLSHHQNSE